MEELTSAYRMQVGDRIVLHDVHISRKGFAALLERIGLLKPRYGDCAMVVTATTGPGPIISALAHDLAGVSGEKD